MTCEIFFKDGIIGGHGSDEVGTFQLEGHFEDTTQKCEWLKVYNTHSVTYAGQKLGNKIEGRWSISDEEEREGEFELANLHLSPEVESLLKKSLAQGEIQESGQFTVNLARAAELLASYRLSNSDEYLLRFVATAVASRATYMKVEFMKPSGHRLSWDGTSLSRVDLEALLNSGFSTESRISEMAIGLGTAITRHPLVELKTNAGRLRIAKERVEIEANPSGSESTVVEMTKPTWFGWLARLRPGAALGVLQERALYAPLLLTLPWGDLVQPVSTTSAAVAFGRAPAETPNLIISRDTDPRLGEGYLLLGEKSQATLVCYGVSYRLGGVFRDLPGRLIWYYNELSLDLSRSGPVQNAEYQVWADWVLSEVERGVRQAIKRHLSNLDMEACQEWRIRRAQGQGRKTEDAHLLNQRAEQNVRMTRYREALEDAHEAASLNPQYLPMVAICLGLLGRFKEAHEVYQRALDFMPGQAWLHSNYAEDLALEGLHDEALRQVNTALAFDPQNTHALALKARFLIDNKPDEALRLAQEALTHRDYPASVWETLAKIHQKRGNSEATKNSLQKFLELANPATLWENDIPNRLKAARQQLDEITGLEDP